MVANVNKQTSTTMSIRLDDSEDNISTHRSGSTLDIDSQSVSTESNSRSFQDTYYYKIIKFFSKFKILYVPILNWALLTFFITMLYKLILKYNTMYETNVLLTTITANVLLYGLSDTLAQNISCFLAMVQQKNNQRTREGSIGSIQLGNYSNAFSDQPDELALYTDFGDTTVQNNHGHHSQLEGQHFQKLSKQTDKDIFNFHRFVGFMFWGFVMAFVQICWYWVLNHFYTQEPTFVSVLERVMSDQLCSELRIRKKSPKLLDAIQNILQFAILVMLIFLIPQNSIMLGFTKRTEIEEFDQGFEERASKPSGFNLKIGFLVIYLSSLMFLLSSNYFEAQLPTKVASFDIEYYQNPSSVLEKIFEITEEGTVKVIEPSLYIDEHQTRLDMMIYEYYNDSSSVNETELNAFSTGLIFLQELESPFKNYFGLNGDLYYDIVDFS
ncbi:unnamed protein product [Wickerhamomyces anomalus]